MQCLSRTGTVYRGYTRACPSLSPVLATRLWKLTNGKNNIALQQQQDGSRGPGTVRTPALQAAIGEPTLETVCADQTASQGHEQGAGKTRRLVVAVNDTEESWCAVKWTLNNIYRDGDVLHLCHCVPKNSMSVPLPAAFLASMNESIDYEDMLEVHAYEFINSTMVEMASSMKAQCQVDVLHISGRGNAGDAVCKYSEDLQAELVVIAAQPMGWMDEFFNPCCMSGHALEHCKKPVLILPPQITRRE